MTILWDHAPDATERYRFALGGRVTQLTAGPRIDRALDEDRNQRLVVVGPDVDLASACELAERVRVEHPAVGVILLRHRLDVPSLSDALRSGIREVVPAEDYTALAEAVTRSRELTAQIDGHSGQAATPEGHIVTVFSAKGGVGKTTLATNGAAYLASTGARTLLVDLDLMFGDVAISLQLSPTHSMSDLVAMSGHLDPQGIASVVTRHETSGLDVVTAPLDPADADRIPSAVVTELLRVAKTMYEFVVVDTPPAFTEHVLAAFDRTDLSLLIATLDIPAVKNLRIAINTLDALGASKESRVVVLNRADTKVGLGPKEVELALRETIAASVPNSLGVSAAVNRGVPIVLDEPHTPVSMAMRELVDHQVRARFGADIAAPAKRRGVLWGRR
ncbi:MAG: AAA family ATPase [Dermatophilaceae bacterium]